jgi:glyoxylase-like metal-dependent hydrolase (beta-lactamase superfamily II)
MQIQSITSGPLATNAYLLIGSMGHALIVDPTFDTASVFLKEIRQNKLIPLAILLTHSHFDHIVDVAFLKNTLKIPVYIHEKDAKNLRHPGSDGIFVEWAIDPCEPDILWQGDEEVELEEFKFKVIHTPGHSFGCCCFYFPKENVLISGDTLFKGTMGTVSLPTSEPQKMWESLKILSKLDPNIKVYPGHGESTTIGGEAWMKDARQLFGD